MDGRTNRDVTLEQEPNNNKIKWTLWIMKKDQREGKMRCWCSVLILKFFHIQKAAQIKEYQSINQSIDRTINQSIDQSINRSNDQSIDRSINQSIGRSINQSIGRSINQSIDRPSVQRVNSILHRSASDARISSLKFFFWTNSTWEFKRSKNEK